MFNWLQAVLEQGDEIVIRDYRYASRILSPEKLQQYSRTGLLAIKNGLSTRQVDEV
jgi:hypothetical protein